jgi:hypothetical protein
MVETARAAFCVMAVSAMTCDQAFSRKGHEPRQSTDGVSANTMTARCAFSYLKGCIHTLAMMLLHGGMLMHWTRVRLLLLVSAVGVAGCVVSVLLLLGA